jgi:hypothetical protein
LQFSTTWFFPSKLADITRTLPTTGHGPLRKLKGDKGAREKEITALQLAVSDLQFEFAGIEDRLNSTFCANAARCGAAVCYAQATGGCESQGPQGSTGPQGSKGDAGSTGGLGATGAAGAAGASGTSSADPRLACITSGSNANEITFRGCNVYVENNAGSTLTGDGFGNLVIGYNDETNCAAGVCTRTGSHNLVLGNSNACISSGGIVSGSENTLDADLAVLLGGEGNSATTTTISGVTSPLALVRLLRVEKVILQAALVRL